MDDYMFRANVDRCRHVQELTSYLEIISYSVSLIPFQQDNTNGIGPITEYS